MTADADAVTTAVLVVGVPDAERLAAACALVRVDATVVPFDGAGAGVVLDDPAGATAAAQRLSRVLGQVELALFERRENQVDATTWRAGEQVGTPAAGAALACLPGAAERLVLGADAATQPGAVSSRGMSRMAAARTAVSGSQAEAAWTAKAQRWDRVASLVLLVLLSALVAWEGVRAASDRGSPVVLGLAIALLGLLGVRELRRRRAP
ncbi:MAG: hypothetical protein ACLGIV_15420 [Actinomycetes bacterium]